MAVSLFSSGLYAQEPVRLKEVKVSCGADLTGTYFHELSGRRIGVVANQSSRIGSVHLVDSLKGSGFDVIRVFAPEHGFRGNEEAGAVIQGGKDPQTGIEVVSLYGDRFKPSKENLADLDLVIFDLQDVGARFYTYISTLHYVMEACAELGIPLLVLDRPNPNGFYVDGPVLEDKYRSFVGMHPVPVVHGMTIGEYAGMINGEGWLSGGIRCSLKVVKCQGYDHQTEYVLPIRPSPNLPNQNAVYLYPSLCFFEGTIVSVGRGTPWPFEVFGHPSFAMPFSFIPEPVVGASLNPLHKGTVCKGVDLRGMGRPIQEAAPRIHLSWLIEAYQASGSGEKFFNSFFDRLAGTSRVREMILKGMEEDEIRESWREEIEVFRKIRSRYLLYPE